MPGRLPLPPGCLRSGGNRTIPVPQGPGGPGRNHTSHWQLPLPGRACLRRGRAGGVRSSVRFGSLSIEAKGRGRPPPLCHYQNWISSAVGSAVGMISSAAMVSRICRISAPSLPERSRERASSRVMIEFRIVV